MLRSKLLAASLATGVALSGAYALSAHAAPTPTPTAGTPAPTTPVSKDRIAQKRAGEAAGISGMTPNKQSYAAGENYTVTIEVTANTDGNYVVDYSKVTGATCQGSGSNTITFSGTNGNQTSKTTSFTCKINSFPVNGSVSLTTPRGVANATPVPIPYTIGGTLPGTPTPTKKPTTKPTKPSTGGLAKTGV